MNINDNQNLAVVAKALHQFIFDLEIDALRDKDQPLYRESAAKDLRNHLDAIETVYLGATDERTESRQENNPSTE